MKDTEGVQTSPATKDSLSLSRLLELVQGGHVISSKLGDSGVDGPFIPHGIPSFGVGGETFHIPRQR